MFAPTCFPPTSVPRTSLLSTTLSSCLPNLSIQSKSVVSLAYRTLSFIVCSAFQSSGSARLLDASQSSTGLLGVNGVWVARVKVEGWFLLFLFLLSPLIPRAAGVTNTRTELSTCNFGLVHRTRRTFPDELSRSKAEALERMRPWTKRVRGGQAGRALNADSTGGVGGRDRQAPVDSCALSGMTAHG